MVSIDGMQFGFMSGKDTTDAMFIIRTVPNYTRDTRHNRWQKDEVITGSGRNFNIQVSLLQGPSTYRECVTCVRAS